MSLIAFQILDGRRRKLPISPKENTLCVFTRRNKNRHTSHFPTPDWTQKGPDFFIRRPSSSENVWEIKTVFCADSFSMFFLLRSEKTLIQTFFFGWESQRAVNFLFTSLPIK